MAKGFGVRDENIYRDEEATNSQMKKTYMQILKKSRALTELKKTCLIMCFFSGYGTVQNDR